MEFLLRLFIAPAALALSIFISAPLHAETFKDAFPGQSADDRTQKMELLHGVIKLPSAEAEVNVPDGYYFLAAADARYILETIWRNPPDPSILGLMFPSTMTPFGMQDWAISFQYEGMGYVSDADAESYDYDALLKEMQADTEAVNPERLKQGYGAVTLVGWAEPPHYDKAERKLLWAKRLTFSDAPGETLNYNIRALGRKGVLVVNFIASMDQLGQVQAAAPQVMKMVSFSQGSRYSDYVPGVDKLAAVGIGGLIAGKVLSSTGVLAVALLFLKKGFFLILFPLAWVWNKVKSGLSRGKPGPGA